MSVAGAGKLYSSAEGDVLEKSADYTGADYSIAGADSAKRGRPARWIMFVGGTCVVKLAGSPDTDVTLTADFAGAVLPYQVATIDNSSTATHIAFGW